MLDSFDKKKNPFKVPENYFENFNASIMEKLPEKKTSAKIVPLWKKVLPWTAVAAVLCGIILNWNTITDRQQTQLIAEQETQPVKTSVNTTGLASVSEEDFYLFVEDQVRASAVKEMMSTDF